MSQFSGQDNLPYHMEDVPLDLEAIPEYLQRELERLEASMGRLNVDGMWEDITAEMTLGRNPSSAPTPTVFGPDGATQQLLFSVNNFVFVNFHILHDIKRGSLIYPHIHWASDGVAAGNITWRLSWAIAKGHDQEAFPSATTVDVVQANSATAWQHQIAEVSAAQAFTAPEVDSVVLMKIELQADTSGDAIFGLFVDLHYQRERLGTVNKAPNFYR